MKTKSLITLIIATISTSIYPVIGIHYSRYIDATDAEVCSIILAVSCLMVGTGIITALFIEEHQKPKP